ncbi:hypothetical protein COV14_03990, partial [Candidatus Woesearchaeota archaeon CG10_big_fil_rev_8_21_14_0_10_33_12]
ITGLIASNSYKVYNNSVEIPDSPLTTNSSGDLPLFNVTLGSEHEIEINLFENTPPTIIANITSPTNVYTNTDFMLNLTVSDVDDGDVLTAYTQFYVSGSAFGSMHSLNVTNNINTLIDTLSHTNFNKGDNLTAEFWAGDETENTTKENTTQATVLNSPPSTVSLSYPE